MNRSALSALAGMALSAGALLPAAAVAQQAKTELPPYPGDLPCLLRTMQLTTVARKAAQDSSKSADDRAKAQDMVNEGRQATNFFVGKLGSAWANGDRAAETEAQFNVMKGTPSELLAREMMVCVDTANAAERKAYDAMSPKKKS